MARWLMENPNLKWMTGGTHMDWKPSFGFVWKYPLASKHGYGKSQFGIGKSTVHEPFSITMLNYQRVSEKTTISSGSSSLFPCCHRLACRSPPFLDSLILRITIFGVFQLPCKGRVYRVYVSWTGDMSIKQIMLRHSLRSFSTGVLEGTVRQPASNYQTGPSRFP